jgi:hypothetical protein
MCSMTAETRDRDGAADAAVLAEMQRLAVIVGDRPDLLAHLYAGAAIRADDEHGRSNDLVIQADELRWADVQHLLRLAEAELTACPDADRHNSACPSCTLAATVARIHGLAAAAAAGRESD